MPSVLQDWVMDLSLREQGTLLTNIRSCDVSPKVPTCIDERYGCSSGEGNADRQLTAFLRFCVLVPADEREFAFVGGFFATEPPRDWKPSQFGHYPLHWFSHLMHGYEIIGYRHPNPELRCYARDIYERLVRSLHLNPETLIQMRDRLTEDRIIAGTVVS